MTSSETGGPETPTSPPQPPGAEGKRPTMLFLHGMTGRYGNKSTQSIEEEARRYANARGYNLEVLPYLGNAYRKQEALARQRMKQGGIDSIFGFSMGGYTVNRMRKDFPGVEHIALGATKSGREAFLPGVPHMGLVGALADQAEREAAQRQPSVTATAPTPISLTLSGANGLSTTAGGTKMAMPQPQFRAGGDPRLQRIMEETSKYLPEGWRVQLRSGYRPRDRRLHGKRMAIDIDLIDPRGRKLNSYQAPENFRTYQDFAHKARRVQMQMYPELANKFAWGGYFGGRLGKGGTYGAMDLMHFDIGGKRGRAGSFEKGLSPAYLKTWGITKPSYFGKVPGRPEHGPQEVSRDTAIVRSEDYVSPKK